MDTDSDVARAFETLPNTPARVPATPATPGDDVRMEIIDLRRSVESNTRQIRNLRPDFTTIPDRSSRVGMRTTPRNPTTRSYNFKRASPRNPIWNASFKIERPSRVTGRKRRR